MVQPVSIRAGEEVGEGVHLVGQLALVVPGTPHLSTTANVGDGEGEPSVEERESKGGEGGVFAGLVGAIPVEEAGSRSRRFGGQIAPIDEADRDLRAICSGGDVTLGLVASGVEVPLHLLALADHGGSRIEVELGDDRRRGQ